MLEFLLESYKLFLLTFNQDFNMISKVFYIPEEPPGFCKPVYERTKTNSLYRTANLKKASFFLYISTPLEISLPSKTREFPTGKSIFLSP